MKSFIENIPSLLDQYPIDLTDGSWDGEIELEYKNWAIRFTAIIMVNDIVDLGDYFNEAQFYRESTCAILNLEVFFKDEPIKIKQAKEEEIINTLINNLK